MKRSNHFTSNGIRLSETLLLTDTATGERGASFEVSLPVETLSFTDSITKSTTKPLSETLSFTVDGTGTKDARSVSLPVESISFTDSITKSTTKLLSESVSFTDSSSKLVPISLSEILSLNDVAPVVIVARDAEDLTNPEYVKTFTLTGTYAGTYAIVTHPEEWEESKDGDGNNSKITIWDVSNPVKHCTKRY